MLDDVGDTRPNILANSASCVVDSHQLPEKKTKMHHSGDLPLLVNALEKKTITMSENRVNFDALFPICKKKVPLGPTKRANGRANVINVIPEDCLE